MAASLIPAVAPGADAIDGNAIVRANPMHRLLLSLGVE